MTEKENKEKVIYAAESEGLHDKTTKKSYLDPDSFYAPWNPDDLVLKQQDFSLYEEMLKDDQVSVCLQLKKDLILCSGYDFIPGDDGQEDIVDDLKVAITEDAYWPFEEMLEEILSSCEFGFSLSEKIFMKRPDGKLSLKCIKTRHPGPWLIHTDNGGNIIRYEQQGANSSIDVPEENLIHFINKRKFQNPYGISDLRAAYQAYFTKKHITRWYAIFIEKAGSPVPVGKYDSAKASNQARQDLYNALKRFQTKSALVIPKEFEVDFLESTSNGEAFIRGINLFNMFIGRSLLIPDLLGFQGSETSGGSYSLGTSQMDVFYKHIQRRREVLERTINNEIVWPIVVHNFGFVENYPRFKLRPITEEQIIESAKLWLDAVKSHVYRPSQEEIDHFRGIINFPATSDEPEQEIIEEETEEEAEEEAEEETEEEAEELNAAEDKEEETEIELLETKDGDDSVFKKNFRKFKPTNGPFAEKTDFNLIENNLNTALDSFLASSRLMVDDIFKDLTEQIDRKKIVSQGRVQKLDSLELKKTAPLKTRLARDLKQLFRRSKEIASAEVFKGNFAKPKPDKVFLDIVDQETNQFIGDWKFDITKKARVLLLAAIKDGKPLSAVLPDLQKAVKTSAAVGIERFARTKMTEVMNKGRVAFFEESGAVQGYQFSAILDDRTTDICRGLHGKKFVAGSQPIPPMHFNCRSMLVPITILEEFTPDTKVGKVPIEGFIEEKKGLGFPKQ